MVSGTQQSSEMVAPCPAKRQVGGDPSTWRQYRGCWQSWDRRVLQAPWQEGGLVARPSPSSPTPSECRSRSPGHQEHGSWSRKSQLYQFCTAGSAGPRGSGGRGHSPSHPGGLAEPGCVNASLDLSASHCCAEVTIVTSVFCHPPSPLMPQACPEFGRESPTSLQNYSTADCRPSGTHASSALPYPSSGRVGSQGHPNLPPANSGL